MRRPKVKIRIAAALPLFLVLISFAATESAKTTTVKGYVLDSACAFTKGLKKPISAECATACAKAGSPLVILTPSATIYWPIAASTPSSSQHDKLLPFACKNDSVGGQAFERGRSKPMVSSNIA